MYIHAQLGFGLESSNGEYIPENTKHSKTSVVNLSQQSSFFLFCTLVLAQLEGVYEEATKHGNREIAQSIVRSRTGE